MEEKPLWMYQDSILSAIKDFSVKGKYRIVGSNATRGMLYGSDYDTNSKIEGIDLLKHVQALFRHPPAVITSFKTGPLHWTRDQVLKGKHGNFRLGDELKKDHMIKIDFVVQTVGGLAECSEVYYNKEQPKKDVIKQLEADVDAYLDTDTMKCLKRLVSIMKYKKGNEEMIQKCIDFFNGQYGLVNYCIAGLETLELVKDKIDVKPYRELIKEKLGRTSVVPAKHVKGTYANIPHLRKIVNDASLKFLRELV